jgi:hypothetical protein
MISTLICWFAYQNQALETGINFDLIIRIKSWRSPSTTRGTSRTTWRWEEPLIVTLLKLQGNIKLSPIQDNFGTLLLQRERVTNKGHEKFTLGGGGVRSLLFSTGPSKRFELWDLFHPWVGLDQVYNSNQWHNHFILPANLMTETVLRDSNG